MKKSKKIISFTLAVLLVISLAVPATLAKAATTDLMNTYGDSGDVKILRFLLKREGYDTQIDLLLRY